MALSGEVEKLGEKYELEMKTWAALRRKMDWAKLDPNDAADVRKSMKALLDKAVTHMDKLARAQEALAAEGAKFQKFVSELGKIKIEK